MLNVNKIESLINSEENTRAIVSRATGINYQTLVSKIKTGSWSANDVEAIADFFKKPIAYFFDREEKPYPIPNTEVDVANDGGDCCRRCKDLEKQILLLEKMVAMYENPPKKETGAANSTQIGECAKQNKAS
jgi:hypothetical protein